MPNRSRAGPSLRAPRLAHCSAWSTVTTSSSRTLRSGRRTVSPDTFTLPARIRARARSRDSIKPVCVNMTSSLGNSEDETDDQADQGAHDDLQRGVAEQLAQPLLLDAAHVHEVLDQPVQHLGLPAGRPPQPCGV